MPKDTIEEYRLSIMANGIRRKLLRHSVEEDETLLVQVRSARGATTVGTVTAQNGKMEVNAIRIDRRGLSYHPSGRINIKSHDGKHQEILHAQPLPLLKQPIFLLFHSAAKVEQFDLDDTVPKFGDHCVDISEIELRRVHAECLIGPKGAFKGEFSWPWGWAARIVYEDAAFYDVCYMVGNGPSIPDDLQNNGIKINQTVLTGTVNQSLLPPLESGIPNLTPAAWASPSAVARQLRALFEHRYDHVRRALGAEKGSYHVKMTMASNGVIAAMEPLASAGQPSAGWVTHLSLNVDQVLEVVRTANGFGGLIDCQKIDPALTNNVEGSVYISNGSPGHYPLVFAARQILKHRYYRIDPKALKNIDQVLDALRQAQT
jgi:hypothetical protein